MSLALTNGLIGAVAYRIARIKNVKESPTEPETADAQADDETLAPSLTPVQLRLGLVLILISGFVAFCYEIAWTRFFAVVLGSSTYSFAIMLTAFIGGIAAGSALLSRIQKRIERPLYFFGWTQILAAALVILTLPAYPYLTWCLTVFATSLSHTVAAFYLNELAMLVLCFLIMFPPTVFLGMSIPSVVKGLSRSLKELGHTTGRVYAWNTTGNVLGALMAGLVLLPWLGMERLISFAVADNALVGLAAVLLYAAPQAEEGRGKSWRLPVATTAAALLAVTMMGSWDRIFFTLQGFRRKSTLLTLEQLKAAHENREDLLFVDDPAGHLMVWADEKPEGRTLILFVNGKADASSGVDMGTQLLLAHVPLLLHPDPKNVMIIGLASGITAGAALTHDIDRADVLEVLQSMPRATKLFSEWNGDPFSDERFHVIFDDARSYVAYTQRKYDVIISEPSNPWAGTAPLFSRDHFERALGALEPDGLYLQWLQGYEISDETVAIVMRSFRSAFPFVYTFQATGPDLMLVGSRAPIHVGASNRERMARPAVRESLAQIGIEDFEALLYFQRLSPVTSDFLASQTHREHTDNNHTLEYSTPRDLFQGKRPVLLASSDERLVSAPSLLWNQKAVTDKQHREVVPILKSLLADPNPVAPVLGAVETSYFHALSRDLVAGDVVYDPVLPDAFWQNSPLTAAQLTARIETLLRRGHSSAAWSTIGPYRPTILFQTTRSPENAAFWLGKVEKWSTVSSESVASRFRNLFIDLLAASHDPRFVDELLAAVGSTQPPSAQWAVLRACRFGKRLCDEVARAYLEREPILWLHRFWILRHPVDPPQLAGRASALD